MQDFRKIINRLWRPRILTGMLLLLLYLLSTEAFYRIVWMRNSQKIEKIECIYVYAVGKPSMGTEALIVAAGRYVPDGKISVVTDDPIGRKVEVDEFFMRKRNLAFTDLNSINLVSSRDRCVWLYSPEAACETATLNPKITFLMKSQISVYFPTAQYLDINTKTITKCLKTMSAN